VIIETFSSAGSATGGRNAINEPVRRSSNVGVNPTCPLIHVVLSSAGSGVERTRHLREVPRYYWSS